MDAASRGWSARGRRSGRRTARRAVARDAHAVAVAGGDAHGYLFSAILQLKLQLRAAERRDEIDGDLARNVGALHAGALPLSSTRSRCHQPDRRRDLMLNISTGYTQQPCRAKLACVNVSHERRTHSDLARRRRLGLWMT